MESSHKNLCFLCRNEIAFHNYQVALIYFLNVIGLKKCAKLDRDCFQVIIELSCYMEMRSDLHLSHTCAYNGVFILCLVVLLAQLSFQNVNE
jgi:hypothetical protein